MVPGEYFSPNAYGRRETSQNLVKRPAFDLAFFALRVQYRIHMYDL
jgi:hypothetical protein